jgi:hypothetical protein
MTVQCFSDTDPIRSPSPHPISNSDACCGVRTQREKSEAASEKRFAARRGAPPLLAHALPPGSAAPRLPRHGPRNLPTKSQSPTRAGPEKQQAGGTGESPDHRPETATTRRLVHLLSSPLLLTSLSGSYWLSTARTPRDQADQSRHPDGGRGGGRRRRRRRRVGDVGGAGVGRCRAPPRGRRVGRRRRRAPDPLPVLLLSRGPHPAPYQTLARVCSSRPTRTRIRAWPWAPPVRDNYQASENWG